MTDTAIQTFLHEARNAMAGHAYESVLSSLFQQHLPAMYPTRPWWVRRHAEGAEAFTRFFKGGKLGYGFVDALVGATAIEYEADLTKPGVEDHARKQVREYVAGQVNSGTDIKQLVGIVSDTLRWKAYTAHFTDQASTTPPFGETDIHLEPIDSLDLSKPRAHESVEFRNFLERHMGRIGARPLNATHLAEDLGLDSLFGKKRRKALADVYRAAKSGRPDYADMIARLWSELVDAIGGGATRQLGVDEYIDEFYLITLAKLICANILDPSLKGRSDDELIAIINGEFFTGRGLPNYVEYDLFGWLGDDAATSGLLTVADAIQKDLMAYDFRNVQQEDLFGALLSKLGRKHTRLILGQELTPSWLARRLVRDLASRLGDEPMRLIDTACGSGALLVEGLQVEAERIDASATPASRAARMLAAVTGFDIDPLAALFAKTNWVIVMKDHLRHLGDVTIPVFHTDSLFAGVHGEDERFQLKLDDTMVEPPAILLTSRNRPVFDTILSRSYESAMIAAKSERLPDETTATAIADLALTDIPGSSPSDLAAVTTFATALIRAMTRLQKEKRNGLWSYVIRNTSRAAQSGHEFNVLAINPPWLALSKIKDNPYAVLLARLARDFGVEPAAQSFLHVEMATVFLLESVRRYLAPDAVFGCIMPSAIMNGNHQNRFRSGAYEKSRRPVSLDIDTIWSIDRRTFKNDAVVVLGSKTTFKPKVSYPGLELWAGGDTPHDFYTISGSYADGNDRVVWSAEPSSSTVGFGFDPAPFRQGADLFPRTAWFHVFDAMPNGRWSSSSPADFDAFRYLVSDSKKSKDFRLPKVAIDDEFVTNAILSHHLTPFHMASPAKMLIPARYEAGRWRAIKEAELVTAGAGTRQALSAIAKEIMTAPTSLFAALDLRRKLSQQHWTPGKHIVLSGAGGANPCAAWLNPDESLAGRVVFDQTVYWTPVDTKDEALYLVGAINSPACGDLIRPFQPRGQQGPRHVHTLPFGVTPPFDADDDSHMALVEATRRLVDALSLQKSTDPKLSKSMVPSGGSLATRRSYVIAALRKLPQWTAYEAAALQVLGV